MSNDLRIFFLCAEQISKDAVFYTEFETEEDFFVEKIQVLSDETDNHFLGTVNIFVVETYFK